MKVKLGPYRKFYSSRDFNEVYYKLKRLKPSWEVSASELDWMDKVFEKFCDYIDVLLTPINKIAYRDRTIKVRIDDYDAWNADHTLALIVYPLLQKLKETKQGTPSVVLKDLPKSFVYEKTANDVKGFTYSETAWDYILDEMIWAFKQIVEEYEEENQFIENPEQLNFIFTPLENGCSSLTFDNLKDPNKPPYSRDVEGIKAYQDRIDNGLKLFGKYFRALWD